MSGFLSRVLAQMERSTAGSEETARAVMKMVGANASEDMHYALFFGDDCVTPQVIKEVTKGRILATYTEEHRLERSAAMGIAAELVRSFEILPTDNGWDLIWYNGLTEPDGVAARLELIRDNLRENGKAVFRTLCWLIEPSPDTRSYADRRFGKLVPLDLVLREAKALGFSTEDFYIAPKSDWKQNFYTPLAELVKQYQGENDIEANVPREFAGRRRADMPPQNDAEGIGEANKDIYMFDLHSEEFSFVYYVLKRK